MTPREQLAHWVELKHAGQVKKYTGKARFIHLLAVAEMANPAVFLGYEIGLCHDLLEDTDTTGRELLNALIGFGYDEVEAHYVVARVVELTDVFTQAAYPDLGRKARKQKEALRLQIISPAAQTVKYCDLIDNMRVVIQHEKKRVVAEYLLKKEMLINAMINGDEATRLKALDIIDQWRLTS